MELLKMQENIVPMHRDMYRMMLGVNEVPEAVLRQYFRVKKCLDRIDGRLSPSDLLRIAMDVGFNPETRRFEVEKPIVVSTVDEPVNTLDLTKELKDEDNYVAETPKQTEVYEPTENDIAKTFEEDLIDDGLEVRVFVDGDIKSGTVVSGEVINGLAHYKVEVDGEIHDLTEDEVEE
jgi:hypothetical protein